MRIYLRILRYALRQWPRLLILGALNALAAAVAVLQPWPMKLLVDRALGQASGVRISEPLERFTLNVSPHVLVVVAAAATLALFVVNSLLSAGITWTWTVAGRRMVYDLAAALFHRLQRLSLLFHIRRNVGDSLALLSVDSWVAYTVTDALLLGPIGSVLTMLTVGTIAWRLDPGLTALSLTVVPAMAASTRFFGRRLVRRGRKNRQAQVRLFSFLQQTLTAIPIVQAFGAEQRNRREFEQLMQTETDRLRRDNVVKIGFGFVRDIVPTLGVVIILYTGGLRVLAGSLSVGSLLVFLSYQRSMQTAFRGLLDSYASLKSAQANVERVLEILDAQELVHDAPGAQPLPSRRLGEAAHVRFEGVVFGYETGRPVLKDVSFDVRPGETVALIGETGAGKSTLASLVPRFFDPWEGRVTVDGTDIRLVQLKSLREQIALVLQDSFVLPLSIADNIAYGSPKATRAEIEAVARAANAHLFIDRLPDGYKTIVGERGATLSGGERQRLAIARALLKNAPILILDEPTSALDATTESLVLDALDRLMLGRTALVIAHRLSTVRRADRIVVLHEGTIVETGTHDELLAAGGLYSRLHASQLASNSPGAAA